MKAFKEIKGENIIIDTNILVYCGRDDYGDKFKSLLRGLTDNGNDLAISAISGFEILKKFLGKKSVIAYYIKLLDYIPNLAVDHDVLETAGKIANQLYNPDKSDSYKKDNDSVIASTVITHGSLLMTCNRADFSLPYWDIVARECVYWEEEEKMCVINVYLVKINKEKLQEKGFTFVDAPNKEDIK